MKNYILFLFFFLTNLPGLYAQLHPEYWQEQVTNLPDSIMIEEIDAVDNKVCWAIAFDSDFDAYCYDYIRTTDGGNTWCVDSIPVSTGITGIMQSISAIDANTAYISTIDYGPNNTRRGGIYKTSDAGATWVHQSTAFPDSTGALWVHFFSANTGVAVGTRNRVVDQAIFRAYTTTDGGNNWIRVPDKNIPLRTNMEESLWLNVEPAVSGNCIWFVSSSGRIFKSADRGYKWNAYAPDVNLEYAPWVCAFQNENTGLYVTDFNLLKRTTNGGANWKQISFPPHIDPTIIVNIPGAEASYMLTGFWFDGKLGSVYTTDAGDTWRLIDTNKIGFTNFASPEAGWAGGHENNKIFKWVGPPLISGSQRYSILDTVYTPSGFPLVDLLAKVCIPDKPNGAAVILAHGASGVPYTHQELESWYDTLANNGYLAMSIDYYSFCKSGKVDNNACYPMQARTFKTAIEFLRKNLDRFNLESNKIAVFGTSAGAVHWGQCLPWTNDDIFFSSDPSVSDKINAAVLLYGYYDYNNYLPEWIQHGILDNHFFHTDSTLRNTKANSINNIMKINAPILLIHGTADDVVPAQQSIQFHNKLKSYKKESQLILVKHEGHGFDTRWEYPYDFTPAGLAVKDSVLLFLERTLLTPAVSVSEEVTSPLAFNLEQNYPNPFNPVTKIKYSVNTAQQTTLKIYDLLGNEVAVLVNEEKTPGVYEINFNASKLASGVYFYQLNAGDLTATKKLLLLK